MKEVRMKSEKGQAILILILVMTVALAIGISVIQRSLSDISTSSKVEQSSRAFSAAEAGIEKAISANSAIPLVNLGNNSFITGVEKKPLPLTGQALEYPLLSKEEIAQVWLADPNSSTNPPNGVYQQPTLDVYWGNSSTDKAALELTIIYYDALGQYQSRKWYLDHNITRSPDNGFEKVLACSGNILGSNNYQCYKRLDSLPSGLMLLRARLLYNNTSQPFAVKPTSGSLPSQAATFISTGTSGNTQRKVQVFKVPEVVPIYFDYSIFSQGSINK